MFARDRLRISQAFALQLPRVFPDIGSNVFESNPGCGAGVEGAITESLLSLEGEPCRHRKCCVPMLLTVLTLRLVADPVIQLTPC